jgi:hypothetical protein
LAEQRPVKWSKMRVGHGDNQWQNFSNDKIFFVFDCQQICQQRSNKGVVPE